ncbi:hypothetical protein D3C73_1087430 [compost metagenome]
MRSEKEYWNETFQKTRGEIKYDVWLDKYKEYLTEGPITIIDLGCGMGNNIRYLFERGYEPVACDISDEALKKVREYKPECETHCFDMREGLPFDDQTIDILIADLSLHYFTEDRTRHVLNDIHRVLKVNGLLLCRLNSLKEITNKGEVRKTQEMYFFKNEGIYRRFFDQDEIQRFFSEDKWEHIRIEEYELNRYTNSKMLWEIAMKPRYIV